LNEAGIVIKETETPAEKKSEKSAPAPEKEKKAESSSKSGKALSKTQAIKKLTQQIEEAIAREDYEQAARLRDEIKKLEKNV